MRDRIAPVLLCLAVAATVFDGVADAGHLETPELRPDPFTNEGEGWQANGRLARDESWRRSDGPFGAMLLLTDQPDQFHRAWNHPGSPGYTPTIHRVSEVRRGDTVAAMIVFARCAPDSLGSCKSEVDFTVLRPDGSVYAANHGSSLWEGPPPPDLQLGNAYLSLSLEPRDPLGRYQIRAAVRDEVAGRRVLLNTTVLVREGPKESPARPSPIQTLPKPVARAVIGQ
jgi:hypothetical protein